MKKFAMLFVLCTMFVVNLFSQPAVEKLIKEISKHPTLYGYRITWGDHMQYRSPVKEIKNLVLGTKGVACWSQNQYSDDYIEISTTHGLERWYLDISLNYVDDEPVLKEVNFICLKNRYSSNPTVLMTLSAKDFYLHLIEPNFKINEMSYELQRSIEENCTAHCKKIIVGTAEIVDFLYIEMVLKLQLKINDCSVISNNFEIAGYSYNNGEFTKGKSSKQLSAFLPIWKNALKKKKKNLEVQIEKLKQMEKEAEQTKNFILGN